MNALTTIKIIRDDIANSEHWLSDQFASALSDISTRMQVYAQQLKELEAERIMNLQDNGPQISIDPEGDVHVVILRNGKEKYYDFSEFDVSIVCTDSADVCEDFKLTGGCDDDCLTYFIRAIPQDFGRLPYGIWISKEEAIKLSKDLRSHGSTSSLNLL